MVCTCSCGKEYGFEPIGYWFCPKCWSLNDSGRISSVVPEDVIEPDEAERMLRSNTDFKAEADSSVRANIHSWKAWYAYGLAYAAHTNLPQASICWTVAITLTDTDEEIRSLADRTARMFVEMMTIFRVGGVRFPLPYLSLSSTTSITGSPNTEATATGWPIPSSRRRRTWIWTGGSPS